MSSNMDPGNRSSADIESEVEATRAGLSQTLDELRDRTSPGQLFEQALDYARSSGGAEFTRNLGSAVRDNPLPLLLIGAGIGWLMLGPSSSRPRRTAGAYGAPYADAYPGTGWERQKSGMIDRASGAVSEAAGSARDGVESAARSVAAAAGSAYRSVSDAVGSVGEAVGEAAESTARGMRGGTGQVAQAISDYAGEATGRAADTASDYAEDARNRMEHWADEAGNTAGWVLREQPLVLGALGVALGAAIGALLPSTEAENRMMGETRDELAEQAGALAQSGYEKVREVVGDQIENAPDASNSVAGLAGRAREVARDLARNVAAEAKEALAQPTESPAPDLPERGPDDASRAASG